MACGEMDHRNAAVMLAQMSAAHAALPTDVRGMPCSPWPYAWHPAMWQQFAAAAAAAAATGAAQSIPTVPVSASATSEEHSRSGTASPDMSECSSRKRGNSQGSQGSNGSDGDSPSKHNGSSSHHSGTQRRPVRDEYMSESEYLAAYQRWRQVRDRNNDAVKRSREKYKAKRKTQDVPPSTREVELEDQLESLKSKLTLMARAYSNQTLSTEEQEKLKSILTSVTLRE